MKNIILIFLFLGTVTCLAQTRKEVKKLPKANIPINSETGLICFTKIQKTELPDSILYKRAMFWYTNDIKSMRVQNEECVPGKKIVGKGELNLMGLSDGKSQPKKARLKYTCITTIKDSVYTLEFTRFNIDNVIYQPLEPWLSKQDEDEEYKYYFIYLEEQILGYFDKYDEIVNVKMAK
ncbi:MAG: hypothetical protein SNJ71_02065 [Bacteroidales bacterium]